MTPALVGVVLVVASTLTEGFAQVFLKKSALRAPGRTGWILLAILFFAGEALFYTDALRLLAVSAAFAISSLSFVITTVLSAWLLRERVTATRWVGVLLIIAGASLIVAYV
jgi:undecaprenyl phosphate-alpha-L-ara4N flippase subunit ArnE